MPALLPSQLPEADDATDLDLLVIQKDGESQLKSVQYGALADSGRDKYVLVNELSDFPDPVGQIITLDPDTTYEISGQVDITPNRILGNAAGLSNQIIGVNPFNDIIITANADSLIELKDCGFLGRTAGFINVTGQIFDCDDVAAPNSNIALIQDCAILNSPKIGTVGSLQGFVMDNCVVQNNNAVLDGVMLTVTGTNINQVGIRNLTYGNNANVSVLCDLTTGTLESFQLTDSVINDANGAVLVEGLSNSGNIVDRPGSKGVISGNAAIGGQPAQSTNITRRDLRWDFRANTYEADSTVSGTCYMEDNSTVTIIPSANVWVKALGTTTAGDNLERVAMPLNNRLRFDGLEPTTISLTCYATAVKDGGGGDDMEFSVFKNGDSTPMTGSIQGSEVRNQPRNFSLAITDLALTGDYYELYVRNLSGNTNVTFPYYQFTMAKA